ncbi:MAG TPA: hypothetical protein VFV00_04595 [Acidimicrobiales bacterium]|nr:hypothetical protein [Acidimicrobiales bacterium]
MADGSWAFARRVIVEDVRRDDSFMRVTWHDDAGVFVVSHWDGEVCRAATRVPVAAVPDLVNLFVRGLAESAGAPTTAVTASPRPSLVGRLRKLLTHGLHRAA